MTASGDDTWVLQSTGELVSAELDGSETIRLKGDRFNVLARRFDRCGRVLGMDVANTWKIDELARFRPLIYFTAFGSPGIFRMLRYCLHSLAANAGCAFDVLIITREEDRNLLAEAIEGIEPAMSRLHVRYIPASTIREYAMARYAIGQWEEFDEFGPILYMDTDIICDASLVDMLLHISASTGKICVTEEAVTNMLDNDFFGRSLLLADGAERLRVERNGLNSGVIGSASFQTLAQFGRFMHRASHAWHEEHPDDFILHDQPLCNYVLDKLDKADRVLQRWVRISGHSQRASLDARRGLTHFCGGVGNSDPKIKQMEVYSAALQCEPRSPFHSETISVPVNTDLYRLIGEADITVFRYLVSRYGSVVRHGPFAGMTAVDEFTWGDACLKLLGQYEHYVHPLIEKIRDSGFDAVINIGCGEGYHAIGLGRLFPDAIVHAHDIQPASQDVCRRAADVNGLASRMRIGGAVSMDELCAMVAPYRRALVFVDADGFEAQLAGAAAVDAMQRHTILCETHDFVHRGVTAALFEAYRQTHLIDVIQEEDLAATALEEIAGLPAVLRMAIVCEKRPERMRWLLMMPRP